jgi:transcriptional regulator with XRE-family HTH domain
MNTVEKILNLMRENNVTASQLSKEIGKSNAVFTQWKRGEQKPSAEAVTKIAQYFNVTTDYLLGLSDVMMPPEQPAPPRKTLTDDELELLGVYRGLDNRGRYALHTKAYEEQDRTGGNRTAESQESTTPDERNLRGSNPKKKVYLEPGMIRVAARGGGGIEDVMLTAEQAKAFNDYDEEVINKDWNI